MIKNQWYAILSSSDIKINQIVSVKRCGLNLVLFRDSDSKLSCLSEYCPHREASLSLGKLKNNCIKCPFHGIEYDKDGKCKFIPALGAAHKGDLSRFNVKKYLVIEKHNIIYLWYGDDKVDKEVPFFDNIIDNSYSFSEFQDKWNTHYSRAIENQLDVVHLPFVHHNTIGRGGKTLVNGPKVIIQEQYIKTSADNEIDRGQVPKDHNEAEIKNTSLHFLFPNIWLNNVSDKIKIIIFFAPVDEHNTILYIRFYNRLTSSKFINLIIAQIGKIGNFVVERQDKRVVITQFPKKSTLKMNENLIKGDLPIIEYRKIRNSLQNK